ncbi:MAG: hypothetical protein B7C24_15725 [Bacteroidetes bacterium 4572_77]|nr:MAG: hypothetical protein B7C24_15725 [Bacteroidetes bacterium 4572_77]
MALIKCPECKKKISEYAKNCPHCGYRITTSVVSKAKADSKNTKIIAAVIIIGIIFILMIDNNSETDIKQVPINKEKIITKYAIANLNVREIPKTSGAIIQVLKPNEAVETFDTLINNYTAILNPDRTILGWSSNKYLQNKPLSKDQLESIKEKRKELDIRKSQTRKKRSNSNHSPNTYIIKDDVLAATSEIYYDDMFNYITDHDDQALNLLIISGRIIILKKETEVFLVDAGFFNSVIRKKGSTQKLWITNEFIKKK